ncbi:cadherin-18-like isoform X2 [Betta splendens]|uniref:Cadherin-18-like isoform X2 n=1 Tax=Betta splendens TaxID=158456 RepID=A0A6P7KW24_BETSP|nr:cadherin-18-like isoform X2 [Betta splendens]
MAIRQTGGRKEPIKTFCLTMKHPSGVATASYLCPLLAFLCAVYQSCGTQANVRLHSNPKPNLHSNSRFKSLTEPTLIPGGQHLYKHLGSISSQNSWVKSRPDTISYPTDRSMSNFQATTISNSKIKLQHKSNQSSNSSQQVGYRSTLSQVARNTSKQSSRISLQTNTKPLFGFLSYPTASRVKIVRRPEAVLNKLPLLSMPDQKSSPNTYYNTTPAPQSNAKSRSKPQPSLQISSNAKANSITPMRAEMNQTQLLDSDKDSFHQPKRGWIWNQFFVLEEHIGPEPQYVGKLHSNSDKGDGSVRYILSGDGAGSVFKIDESTGAIHTTESLDRETKSQYVLHASAIDRKTNRSMEVESEFIIKVQDVNDNAPTFPDGPFFATVPEMSDIGTSVFQVTASDADDPIYGNSAKIVYSILEGESFFSVDPKTESYHLYVPELAPVGRAVGRVRATDEDEGQNADMTYSITNADAAALFTITLDADCREGIISLKQPLNYEKRKVHTLNIEGSNTHVDQRFFHLGPFRDSTSLRVIVGDVDEPPVFSMDYYIMDVYENSPFGTLVGSVTALDPDSTDSAVRYFIENEEEKPLYFSIGVNDGIIRTTRVLDREETAWHNITVMAAEVDNPRMVSQVPVTVQVLDVNDNSPTISGANKVITVCESIKHGQVIQTIQAVDLDNFANGKFSFSVPTKHQANANFTMRDNGDNTASILAHRRENVSQDREQLLSLVIVVADGGEPPLSSTVTLSLRLCVCQRDSRGRSSNNVCEAQAFLSSAGLSVGAFIAILLCTVILVATVMLFMQLRNRKVSKEALILSEEDIRENVVTYDDEGGGEEDTEAFDIAALRNPKASGCEHALYEDEDDVEDDEGEVVVVRRKKAWEVDYRDYSPECGPAWFVINCLPPEMGQSAPPLLLDSYDEIQQLMEQKLSEADSDTRGPPYDSLQTYAYEGCGSLAGSVSSLGLTVAEPELNYSNWALEGTVRVQTNPDTL